MLREATGIYYWVERNYAVNISFWMPSQPTGCQPPNTCMLQSRQSQVDETTYTVSKWSLQNCSMSQQFVCEYHCMCEFFMKYSVSIV